MMRPGDSCVLGDSCLLMGKLERVQLNDRPLSRSGSVNTTTPHGGGTPRADTRAAYDRLASAWLKTLIKSCPFNMTRRCEETFVVI